MPFLEDWPYDAALPSGTGAAPLEQQPGEYALVVGDPAVTDSSLLDRWPPLSCFFHPWGYAVDAFVE